MPSKEFAIDDDLSVSIHKRHGNRYIRLTITPTGQIRVSIPSWAPYRVGLDFALARKEWIQAQRVTAKPLKHGQAIGKAHHLHFVPSSSVDFVSGRLIGTRITVSHPSTRMFDDPQVQQAAQTACIRALRRQAQQLLPRRLNMLAETHTFTYADVKIKNLKSRWGSCDHHGNITLNLFLMQLPWDLIDYVLLHELTHTRVLRHGPDFWSAMAKVMPDAKVLKQKLRDYHPVLLAE